MRRPQRDNWDADSREWFTVVSKAHSPDAYPSNAISVGQNGYALPCVYSQTTFRPTDAALTERDGTRQDFVWSLLWHPVGTVFMATRIGNRLYGLPLPEGYYSVRSYVPAGLAGAGNTRWTADYWRGSTATFTASSGGPSNSSPLGGDTLKVTVDGSGNVYVAGPRATTSGGTHWNLIKYDGTSGGELWKVDIDTSGTAKNIWDVKYNPTDSKLWILGDATVASSLARAMRIDPATGAYIDTITSRTGIGLSLIDVGTGMGIGPVSLATTPSPSAFPYYQSVAGGKLLTFGSNSSGSDTSQLLVLTSLPDTGAAYSRKYLVQDFSAWPHLTPSAADLISGGTAQLIAASASILYFNDSPADNGKLVLLDTGLDAATYPITYRWKDASRLCTQLKFQDSSYLVTGASGNPTVKIVQTSDGSKVYAHNHNQPTGIAIASDAVITVGTRKQKSTDSDFV